MKRARSVKARGRETKRLCADSMPLIRDCERQLAEGMRGCDGVIAVDSLECVKFEGDAAACSPLEALSLLLLEKSNEQRTDSMLAHRQTWWGVGVLRSRESDVAYHAEDGAEVLWNVVPLLLTMVPWQVQLPHPLQDLVLRHGHFVSIGECDYGGSNVCSFSDTFMAREAVCLLRGLPRCCVQAVSGRFPLFRRVAPPFSSAAPRVVAATDADWSLLPPEEVPPAQCAAAAHRHARGLMPFTVRGLSSLMDSFGQQSNTSAPKCWVVVSYPDGVPCSAAASDEADCISRDGMNTVGSATRPQQDGGRDESVDQSAFSCEAAPFFVLPSHLLCQSLRVALGWRQIPPSSRPVAAAVLTRLCSLVNGASLHTDQGVKLTSRTAWYTPPATHSATMRIQKASSM
ncbi:hypothetical protein JKF63_05862 [Porcisia hertigi]|uniref:Uncharacterized protein n=1 Tax=Porcisia hertigi TaxID=2761500 RepID=A0A836IUX8_9TRYP|nr:hypothetical protein JKF63_05862 [Porcisia hertigi]